MSAIDLKRVLRKLKGPLVEPEEVRIFAERLKVMKHNMIAYKELVVEARRKYAESGPGAGSSLKRICDRIRVELEYRDLDLLELMKLYDKGNGRVRIPGLI